MFHGATAACIEDLAEQIIIKSELASRGGNYETTG
jgi:hypothetical protein